MQTRLLKSNRRSATLFDPPILIRVGDTRSSCSDLLNRRRTVRCTLFQPSARAETSQPGQAPGVLGSPRDRKSELSLNCPSKSWNGIRTPIPPHRFECRHAQTTAERHSCQRFPKPRVAGSVPAEGTKPAPADPGDPLGHLCAPNYESETNPAGGVSVFGRDFTTLFRLAVIRTRPNRSTSWACARSAAGSHASHVSSGRSRFGSGRSSRRRCTGGAASNHTCVITTSRADDRFVTFTK
jgi:hypothetical protein